MKNQKTFIRPEKFEEIQLRISKENSKIRLDKALSQIPKIATRSQALHLIRKAYVKLKEKENEVLKASRVTELNEIYTISFPIRKRSPLEPFRFPIDILMEDESLLVINKPAGLVTHPSPGHEGDSLVNALIYQKKRLFQGLGQENRPGILHRLDKDTSGLLVLAKNKKSHEHLSLQFKERQIKRTYLALVFGFLNPSRGRLFSFIRRHPIHRKKFFSKEILQLEASKKFPENEKEKLSQIESWTQEIINKERQKEKSKKQNTKVTEKWALTHYREKAYHPQGISLVECRLETGRTHQIRVHFSKVSHPLLGDELYGNTKWLQKINSMELKKTISSLNRVALHAKELEFKHPETNKTLFFKAPLPQDLSPLMEELKFLSFLS